MTATLMGEKIDESPVRARRRLPPAPRVVVAVTILVRLISLLAQHIHSLAVGQGGFNALPYGGLDDGRYYYTTAEQLADGVTPPYVLNWFPRVLAVLMDLGIRDLLTLKLISFLVSSISVVMIASMAWYLSIGMRFAARRWTVIVASVLGSLFPSSVFWTTNSLMRDGWILSFALVAIWAFSGAGRIFLPRMRWVLGLLALVAATSFRPYVLPIFLAAYVTSGYDLINPMRRLTPRIVPVLLRLTMLAVAFIVACLVLAPTVTNITGFDILGWRTQEQLSDKGSSMGLRFDSGDNLIVVLYYLYSLVSNAVGPLPFQVKTPNQMIAFVEYPFFILVIVGLFKANYHDRLTRFCALFGLYWILLLGLWNDVLGNAARNRIMAWPILALAAAPAIAQYLSLKFNPVEIRGSGHWRHFDRRTWKRRYQSRNPEPAGPDPTVKAQSDPPLPPPPEPRVFVPVSEEALAEWLDSEDEIVETQAPNDERRTESRRGPHRRIEEVLAEQAAGELDASCPVDEYEGPRQAIASAHWFSVIPVADRVDAGQATATASRRSRTAESRTRRRRSNAKKSSRSADLGRKEQ